MKKGELDMYEIKLHRPSLDELSFRRSLLEDPETMAYNHAYGGTISFPKERWADWYAHWVEDEAGERFYRYLLCPETGKFVGEAAYHFDSEFGGYVCDVLVSAGDRGQGFGRQGLALLCAAAKGNGVKRLMDNIALDNPSVELFRRMGFRERLRTEEYALMEKEL